MLSHHLKIALRQFKNNKVFTIINGVGLMIGMASFLVIFQFVRYELNYDNIHPNAENIYRIRNDYYQGGTLEQMSAGCPAALAPALKDNFSEVKDYVRLLRAIRMVVSNEQENRNYRSDDIYFADPSFMSVFSFPMVSGQSSGALDKPNMAVITESFARKTFGDNDPIGQTLRFHSRYFDVNCQITAVLKDTPANSNLQFEALLSMPTYLTGRPAYGKLDSWNFSLFFAFLRLNERVDSHKLEAKLPAFVASRMDNSEEFDHSKFVLERLDQIHLNNHEVKLFEEATVGKQTIYLLLLTAIVIMIIAWVNYLNLSTAKAMDRAKEVGVCKVSGAHKLNLIGQFFFESFLFNIFSLIITIAFIYLFKGQIIRLFDKPVNLNLLGETSNLIVVLCLFVGGAIISGTYPAFILSSYKPVSILKGKVIERTKTVDMRKVLVVFQFAASVFLIAGVFAIFQQVKYMRQLNLGMDVNQLLVVRTPVMSSDSLLRGKLDYLKDEIRKYPELKGMAGSYYIPGKEIRWKNNVSLSQDSQEKVLFNFLNGDLDFVPTFGFKIVCGRGFSETMKDGEGSVILNETGIRALGFDLPEQALNQIVYFPESSPLKVIGVIADYHHLSAKEAFEPTAILYSKVPMNFYSFKINSSEMESTLGTIETLWKDIFPHDPFDYFFLNDFFDQQYKTEIWFTSLFTFFTVIAIFVACLGLFGLSYHSTVSRTKEIGIRKTLGSSIWGIVLLLGKDTFYLILVSSIVAMPCFAYFISSWLDNYAFSIEISWWFFVLPVIFLAFIAFGTISIHVSKTARQNPAEALRYE